MSRATAAMQVTALVMAPEPGRMQATLGYTRDDPYAIHIEFPDRVVWSFARELLARGLREAAGLGDVRLWPVTDGLLMALSSPEGRLLLFFNVSPVRSFLGAAYDVVPAGLESRHVDVDAAIGRLLDGVL